MATANLASPSLTAGDNLSRDEFMRLWKLNTRIKRAELIGGVVYMASPLSAKHGSMDNNVGCWLGTYKAVTPGLTCEQSATTYLLEDVPQPDLNLRILPEYGGKSWIEGEYIAGAPELLAEICLSSTSYDLHQKFDLYEAASVQEYLAVLLHEKEIRWHYLDNGKYQRLSPGADGVWRSRVFPGLWLDGAALLQGDMRRVLERLQEGIASAEHQAFASQFAGRK
jgi:Uma2 family endonuclease